MRKIKILFALLLCALTTILFVGCEGGPTNGGNQTSGSKSTTTEANPFMSIEDIMEAASHLSAGTGSGVDVTNPGTPNFTVPEGGYDGSNVTIKFYHTMGAPLRKVLDKYIVEFNKLYPNITIEHEQVGGYDDVRDQISTELAGHQEPNIAYCYPDHVALYNLAGSVTTLDNLIDSKIEITRADESTEILGLTDAQKADFIQSYYEEGMQFGDGLMYTMPLSKSTEVLFYNKTFFDANEIEVPDHWFSTGDGDTKSMEYAMAKIKSIKPDSIPLGYDSEANWFITMCEQCGSGYTSADENNHFIFANETNYSVLNRFKQWYTDGLMTTQTLYGSYTSGLFVNQDPTLASSYMSIGSTGGTAHQRPEKVTIIDDNGDEDSVYPFEVGIAPMPQMNQNYRRVISQGPSLCIFQKSNPQEVVASWLFVKYLATNALFQAEFSDASGYTPVINSAAEVEFYKTKLDNADGYDNITYLGVKVALDQRDAYYTSPAFNGSSTARDQVGALLCAVLTSENKSTLKANYRDIKSLFQDAIDECEYQG